MTQPVLLIVAGLSLFLLVTWRQTTRLPSNERPGFWIRNFIYLASILIVAWPLQLARPTLGGPLYVASAIAILLGGFGFGLWMAKLLAGRANTR